MNSRLAQMIKLSHNAAQKAALKAVRIRKKLLRRTDGLKFIRLSRGEIIARIKHARKTAHLPTV